MAENRNEEPNWLQRVTESLYGLALSDRQLRNRRRGRFIFTDKKHPWRGVFSVIVGAMSFLSLILAILLTYRSGIGASGSYAFGAMLSLIYAGLGLTMGILARREREIYFLFPNIGIAVNAVAAVCVLGVLYLGLAG